MCRNHNVRSLWLFGSATTEAWEARTSDFDFLVDFGEYKVGVAKRYLSLADGLEHILGRPIDLLTVVGLANNARLERRIHTQRVVLYESGRDRTAA